MIYSHDKLTFEILSVNKVVHNDGFFAVKGRPFSALAFRLGGKAEMEVDGNKFVSSEGDIMYLPKNMDYKVNYSNCEYIVVHLVECNYNNVENIHTDNYNVYSAYFNELMEYWNNTRGVNGAKSRIYKIFQKLEEMEKFSSIDEGFNNCLKYINENFTDCDVDIHRICKENFVSESGLRRKFHNYMNMSPKQYLLKLRVENAVRLLTEGRHSVKDVAEMSGFSDDKYFSRVIKNKYGIPPSMFFDRLTR